MDLADLRYGFPHRKYVSTPDDLESRRGEAIEANDNEDNHDDDFVDLRPRYGDRSEDESEHHEVEHQHEDKPGFVYQRRQTQQENANDEEGDRSNGRSHVIVEGENPNPSSRSPDKPEGAHGEEGNTFESQSSREANGGYNHLRNASKPNHPRHDEKAVWQPEDC